MTEEALDPSVEPVEPAAPSEEGSAEPRPKRRRRRRGGRGRGRGRSSGASTTPSDTQAGDEASPEADRESSERGGERVRDATREPTTPDTPPETGDGEGASKPKRRRRRRRPSGQRSSSGEAAENGDEGGEKTEAKTPAKSSAKAKPSERAEPHRAAPTRTSRAARRTATDRRRRRTAPVQAERRTDKTMLVTEHHDRLQIGVLEARELVEHYVARTGATSMVGNIYLGRVQNVLPGMEAAFIDIGRGRNGVLYAGEVSYDEDVDGADRRIERALKAGQSVLVQVTKDPLRGKGARLTAQVSLPGRYLVYVPDGGASGISRRLPDADRERLRKIVKKIRPAEGGVIVRTAAEEASEEDLTADLERLKEEWDGIQKKTRRARAPKAVYEEPELLERVVRDVFSPAEFERIVTDSRDIFERIRVYFERMAPDLLDRLQLHEGALPLFEEFHVAEQIHKALERKVWLPSGGYLIIDRTEAMTVIDVNTGKHVGKTNLEETVFATNLEAASEVARQLRLRDIGGIIVVDFIDMLFEKNRNQVIRTLQEALSHDKTRSQVFDITPLGLLEMTRKKVSAGLLEAFSEPCPTCEGRGILLTHDV